MAGKKKQILIPQTSTTSLAGMSKKELREWCKKYYSQHFIGNKVKNHDLVLASLSRELETRKHRMERQFTLKKPQRLWFLMKC